jgi:hypothetical protein
MTPEGSVKAHLVKRVRQAGGDVRFIKWIGRNKAPDALCMFTDRPAVWVETKADENTFPKNGHERAQQREHVRMRKMRQTVLVLGTVEAIDRWLGF